MSLIKWNNILALIAIILIALLFYSKSGATTTTTTLSPFHKKFISLCKTNTAVLKEPYKTDIRNMQIAKGCP